MTTPKQFMCSLNYLPLSTEKGKKRLTEDNSCHKPLITGDLTSKPRTQYQEYTYKHRQSINHTHSILNRFQTEFHRTLTLNIKEEQHKIAKRMLSIKPSHTRSPLAQCIKSYNKRTTCPNFSHFANNRNQSEAKELEEDISLTEHLSLRLSHNNHQTFTATCNYPLSSQGRVRSFDLQYNDNWRVQLGLYVHEVKYSHSVLNDFSFQYSCIKDEFNLIYENYTYFKRNFLLCNDMLISFKNKAHHFQVYHNKTIEETICLLNRIPQLILMDYYQHTDRIISVQNILKNPPPQSLITNEVKCYIENANILNSLVIFSKCCFDVYLTLGLQVHNFSLSVENFNLLRGILEKTRFDLTKIISESKACIKDFIFERGLVENYQSSIEEKQEQVKKNKEKLEVIIRKRFLFGDNEQSQKKKRMNIALYQGTDDNKRKVKRSGEKGKNDPMAMIVSQ